MEKHNNNSSNMNYKSLFDGLFSINKIGVNALGAFVCVFGFGYWVPLAFHDKNGLKLEDLLLEGRWELIVFFVFGYVWTNFFFHSVKTRLITLQMMLRLLPIICVLF